MKTLKITLMLALFLMVSSQTDMTSINTQSAKNADIQKTTESYLDLLAHTKDKVIVPTRG